MSRTSSPWGAVQSSWTVADGIVHVTTAGHGGILLSAARMKAIPDYMRQNFTGGGAFEEDCDWCIPALIFPDEFRAYDIQQGRDPNKMAASAEQTLCNWHPEKWEKFYGRKLSRGESMKRDEANFKRDNAARFIVRTAWGSWHASVPEGMVGVCARRESDGAERYFMVPKDEYTGSFVIDESRHQACQPIQ